VERSRDPDRTAMQRPNGVFLVAFAGEQPLACVGLKGSGENIAEVKRLWIAPTARGQGLATRLMTEVEGVARDLGVEILRLDTNRALPEAVAMYRKLGWREISRFNDDPYADYFFEKLITTSQSE
jgi:GNAT superfamily N-acetyltransferase